MRCDLLLVIPSVVSRTATPQQNARDSLKGLQRYKRGKSVDRISGSAGCRLAHAARVLAKPSRFRGLLKIVSARRRNQNARRVRYPAACAPRNSLSAPDQSDKREHEF